MKLFGSKALMAAFALAFLAAGGSSAKAQVTPPDLTVCDDVDPCDAPRGPICDGSGFEITLTSFTPAPPTTSGNATYSYSICSPALGKCSGDATKTCDDNSFCSSHGWGATCDRACAVNDFHALSHTDIGLPALLGGTCLSAQTQISVSCSSPANGAYAGVLGDGACFAGSSPVAKCDQPNLNPGQCLTMTISIAGELNAPGLGAAILVDKPGSECHAACFAGPSCDSCLPPPGDGACLTRTIGFWGNHPWITNNYAPVTVCGETLGCTGGDDGKSNPSCPALSCDSIIEGLCSIPGELRNTAYVALVRQLTAAKLNLSATDTLFGSTCPDFVYDGKSIEEWIAQCEGMCDSSKSAISRSGCIEALDAFNNSQDVGFDMTPSPFDRPSVDDHGSVSGADPTACQEAHGTAGHSDLVIGERTRDYDCR